MQFRSGNKIIRVFVAIVFLAMQPIFSMAQIKTTVPRNEVSETESVEKEDTKPETSAREESSDQSEASAPTRTVQEKFRDELLEEIKKSEERITKQLDALEDRFMSSLEQMRSNDVDGVRKRIDEINVRIDGLQVEIEGAKETIRSQYQPLILMRRDLSDLRVEVDELKFKQGEHERNQVGREIETQKRFDEIGLEIKAIYENFAKKVDLSSEVAGLKVTIQKNEKLIELIRQRISVMDGSQAQNASEAKRLSDKSLEIADRLTALQESSEQMKNQISKLNDLDGKFMEFAAKLDELERNKTNIIDSDYERENITSELTRFNEDISRLESVSRDAGDAATAANEELQIVMERINKIERDQLEVGDLRFMREKLDALEYQLNASDFSQRIAEIEQNLKKLEEKLTSGKVEMPKEKSKVKN